MKHILQNKIYTMIYFERLYSKFLTYEAHVVLVLVIITVGSLKFYCCKQYFCSAGYKINFLEVFEIIYKLFKENEDNKLIN